MFRHVCSHRIVHMFEHSPILAEHGPSVCVNDMFNRYTHALCEGFWCGKASKRH